jgi:hypothetical protein
MALTSTGLANGGTTIHYRFGYDDSLSAPMNPAGPEPARANDVIAVCEGDYGLMSRWFGNIGLDVNAPMTVNITPNGGGASWGSRGRDLTVTINPGNGDASHIRYLLVSEIVEVFMRAQGRNWYGDGNEGSEGEGLSRFLGAQFLAQNKLGKPPANFTVSNIWLRSDRPDFVNNTDPGDHDPDVKSGCSTLFLYYLNAQLGHSVERIVSAGAKNLGGVYHVLTGTQIDPFPRFKRLLDHYFPGRAEIHAGNLDNPFPLFNTARGALLAGSFRTFRELAAMSHEDQRNTLIVELSNRTNQAVSHFQAMNDATLGAAGALLVFIRVAGIRDDGQIKLMSDDELRNTMIVEMAAPSQIGVSVQRLQGMDNMTLVLLGLGRPGWYIRGVLLAGRFRSYRELAAMHHDDHRNTLIVEMANRTKLPVSHYQSLNDADLAAVGALLVFIRAAQIRNDAEIKAMSDDDLRNTMIVEMAAPSQTGFSIQVLQGLSTMDLILLGLGQDV